ncbi:MAG: hypothetical protein KJO49_03810 [Bacteroidia bacterium]|nr:hypothetical protein [Bacteroidia bacterium]NNL79998.1 hypothetical protein [Flavobacteriaceae bacterium]
MSSSSRNAINTLSNQPHIMFWLSIPFVLIIGLSAAPQFNLIWNDQTIILSSKEVAFIISLFYLVLGSIYAAIIKAGKPLNTLLTVVHLFCSLDLAMLFWIVYLFIRTSSNGSYTLNCSGLPEIMIGIMVFGQIFLIINLIAIPFRSKEPEEEQIH